MIVGITGANGFIGQYLSDYLTSNGIEILAMCRSSEQAQYHAQKGRRVFIGDLTSPNNCDAFVKKTDLIIHLAHSNTPMSKCDNDAKNLIQNITPTLNLIESIKRSNKHTHLIYASSGGTVYAEKKTEVPFSETDTCLPTCSYGIQKYTLENYITCYSQMEYFSATILRISNPYGMLLPSDRKQGLIGVVLNRIKNGQAIKVFGDPQNIRDYIHLDDLCSAFLSCLKTRTEGIYNIGSGVGKSVNDVFNIIESTINIQFPKEYVSNKQTEKLRPWVILNLHKAERELGWRPSIEFESGLKTMLCNYK